MSFSSWLSRRIFVFLDSDRVFEEMDQMTVEEKILEHQELEDGSSSFRWLVSSTVIAIGGATVALYISGKIDWKIPAIEAG